MARSYVDTSVLFAGGYTRDGNHDRGLAILRGIDDATLPEGTVLDYVLAETCNGLLKFAGHDAAVDMLTRLEENRRFHIERLDAASFALAKDLFRRREPLSLVDAAIVSAMRRAEVEYIYSFDGDFDGLEGVRRLASPSNPYGP